MKRRRGAEIVEWLSVAVMVVGMIVSIPAWPFLWLGHWLDNWAQWIDHNHHAPCAPWCPRQR